MNFEVVEKRLWNSLERIVSTFAEILADPRVPQGRFNAGIRATRFSRKEHAVRSLSRAANNKNHAPFSRCLFFPRLDFDRPSPQTIREKQLVQVALPRRDIVVRVINCKKNQERRKPWSFLWNLSFLIFLSCEASLQQRSKETRGLSLFIYHDKFSSEL